MGLTEVIIQAYGRAISSYSLALEQYEQRVLESTQPYSSGINSFNVVTQERLLVSANLFYLAITGLLFVKMKRRVEARKGVHKPEPRRLRWTLALYNASNVIISSYIAIEVLQYKLRHKSAFMCNALNTDPDGQRLAWVFYLFFLQKLWEFMDTWFFLLRKSFRQVTFLHLFHHASINVVVGSILPFEFNGDMYLPILLNSAVHVLVYAHYLLTAFGLRSWWAPYLTALQLGQFSAILTQSLLAYFEGPACGAPDFVKILLIVYMGSMWVMFWVFFLQRYVLNQDPAHMCGVIKSLEPGRRGAPPAAAYHGNAKLGPAGRAVVRMPRHFTQVSESVMYCYQVTAVGQAMPDLHVAEEITLGARGHRFAVAGGKPSGHISWMVTSVPTDDRIAH
mmetsp:Transcript_13433/g.20973  ORF Transcript_13433/g.20973 Transcript_13433/m.20973 type:complete len:393 (-) Transcript_13433:449-1627(-)